MISSVSNNFHDRQREVALPLLPDRSEPGGHGEQGEGDHCGDYLLLHNVIISALIFVIVFGNFKHCYDIILILALALHYLSCAQRDVSIKETTAQVLLGRVAIYTSAGAAEVLDTDIFTNAL